MAEYVISDPHLGHEKLRRAVRTQFDTDQQLADYFVKQWNTTVTENDIVYVLGDLGTKDYIEVYFPLLKGTKVLLLGNHDNYSKEFYDRYFDYVYNKPFYLTSRILLSHIPQPIIPGNINIHGHTHEIYLDIKGYYNVCVEMVDYKPVKMKKFYNELGKMIKPTYRFLYEWFAPYQKTDTPRIDLQFMKNGKIDLDVSRKKIDAFKAAKALERNKKKQQ